MRFTIAFVLLALSGAPALAQEDGDGQSAIESLLPRPKPTLDGLPPDGAAAPDPASTPAAGTAVAPVPYAPAGSGAQPAGAFEADVTFEARLTAEGPALSKGVSWRVFSAKPGSGQDLELVATARGGTARLPLQSGAYVVHAAFGRAGATKRVDIAAATQTETLILDAGGLRLNAVVGEDRPIEADRLTFEVSQETENGHMVILPRAAPGLILRLNAGTYQVESRYGSLNAITRAEIAVEPGKLTDAILRHDGAEATLKLVSEEGGEALANTSWTVLTQAGDTVHESVGAFPRLILAEGNYTAVARHKGKTYSRDFEIESAIDRDVEVRLSDVLEEQATGAVR